MDEVERVLGSLGFERDEASGGAPDEELAMRVPYWRSDVAIEDDLVEEVARIVGYDNIPTTMLSTPIPHHEPNPLRTTRETLRDLVAAAGMQEVISYSLTDSATLDAVDAGDGGPEPIRIANPMSSEMRVLRTSLRGSILRTLASNLRVSRGEGLRLFEIGSVYLARDEAKERDLPEERQMAVGVLAGPRDAVSWLVERGDMDFFDAKGVVESVLDGLSVEVEYEPSSDSIMRQGRTARLTCGGTPVGVVGEVHPNVLASFDLGSELVALFEVDLRLLANLAAQADRRYESASRFPESHRDLALIVSADVSSDDARALIEANRLVTSATPFDVYSGEGVPAGKKSIAYRVVYQSKSSTLTSRQVDGAQRDIVRRLRRRLGAELRTRPDEKESGRSDAW
jgi:phenylalanyl-tRNA synthetase beta chain